jgi:hypothetical protein
MQPFNLFLSKRRHGLVCAVPEERSVPSFLNAPNWAFAGKLQDQRDAPLGFDDKAAAAGVRFNGFYLFADFRRDPWS